MEGEVVVELGRDAVARVGHLRWRARVVAAFFEVALQRLRIRPGAEAPPLAGHDDHSNRLVRFGLGNGPAVLGVHPAGPGVQAVGAAERDHSQVPLDRVLHDFEFHATLRPP